VGRQRAPGALVGERGVDVAVGDHDLAAVEGRLDDGVDVLGLVGGVEQQLGAVRQRTGGRVEDDPAYLLADGSVARLEGEQYVVPGSLERRGERPGLRGLARTLAALETDEDAGGGVHAARLLPWSLS